MSRRKYLYRVTAHYSRQFTPDGPPHEWTAVRHYQSRGAAEHRAALLREGRAATGYFEPSIAKADRVIVERSAPVDGWAEVTA